MSTQTKAMRHRKTERGEKSASARIGCIVNPVAGGGKALRGLRVIFSRLGRSAANDHYITDKPGDASELASTLVSRDFDAVIVLGGDGTLHEVVNGLMSHGMRNGTYVGPKLGLLPLGRGNDFARTFDVNGQIVDLWRSQTERVNSPGGLRSIDVGRIKLASGEKKYFANMCGFGFVADVAATANRVPRFLTGATPYLLGIFTHFAQMRTECLDVKLHDVQQLPHCDNSSWYNVMRKTNSKNDAVDIEINDEMLLVLAGVGRYIGSGMKLLPRAEPADGMLDVMFARSVTRMHFLDVFRSSFGGGHIADDDVAYFRARRITVTPVDEDPSNSNVHADGDHIGVGAATIDLIPAALPVLF